MRALVGLALVLTAGGAGAIDPASVAWIDGSGCGGTECSTTVRFMHPKSWVDVSVPATWEVRFVSDVDARVILTISISESPVRNGQAADIGRAGGGLIGHNALAVTELDQPVKMMDVPVSAVTKPGEGGVVVTTVREQYRMAHQHVARDVVAACEMPPDEANMYEDVCRKFLQSIAIVTE